MAGLGRIGSCWMDLTGLDCCRRLHFKQLHCARFGVKKVSSQSLTTSWANEAFLERRKASDFALTVAVSFMIGSFCFF